MGGGVEAAAVERVGRAMRRVKLKTDRILISEREKEVLDTVYSLGGDGSRISQEYGENNGKLVTRGRWGIYRAKPDLIRGNLILEAIVQYLTRFINLFPG